MDTTEFRRGNIISARHHKNESPQPAFFWLPITIDAIHDDYIVTNLSQHIPFSEERLKPEVLTVEWFVKFGYKPEYYGGQGNVGHNVFVKGLGRLFSHDGLIWHSGMALGNFLKQELKYVHQFQNLHYALRGQELTIKEKETESS